ncbi:MAG: iron-containing alcohol dehydrogenase [Treponema sp.]|nr:iron-containing alcohol dehydrogenase [Treponema sp.]
MFVIFCRVFQFIFNFAARLLPWKKAILVDGQGSIARIPDLLRLEKVKKPMLVTGDNLVKAGVAQRIIDILVKAKYSYVIFTDVEPNPSVKTADTIQKLYLDHGCDGIIALGGGSPIDAAKGAAARIVKPKKTVNQLGGLFKILTKLPPFIAIPTTAGTGSETTIAALITDTDTRHKYAIMDLNLVPRFAILDPDLTVSLPPHVTSTTGMDALTHAVEAYLCWTYNTAESIQFALDAVRLIFANLEKAYNDGSNIEARQAMLSASFKAGFAFTRSGVGNIHAIAHTLGGLYNTPHGLANAVILPKVLENYGDRVHKKLAQLAEAAGLLSGFHTKTNAEKARIFIDAIYGLNERMGIPKGFNFIKDEDIDQMINWAGKESNPIYPVPVIFNGERFRKVIEIIRQE